MLQKRVCCWYGDFGQKKMEKVEVVEEWCRSGAMKRIADNAENASRTSNKGEVM